MPKLKDISGKRYGKLTVIKRDIDKTGKRVFWKCQCDCGNVVSVRGDSLGRNTNSCGCVKKEQDVANLGRYTTGESHSRLASIWYHMITRCYNPKAENYKYYGSKGIKVCDLWHDDFTAFKEWADSNGYTDCLSLDRINPAEDYTPDNCRWVSLDKQYNNKRNTLWVLYNGEWLSLKEAYKAINPNISYQTAKKRYHNGVTNIGDLFADRFRK